MPYNNDDEDISKERRLNEERRQRDIEIRAKKKAFQAQRQSSETKRQADERRRDYEKNLDDFRDILSKSLNPQRSYLESVNKRLVLIKDGVPENIIVYNSIILKGVCDVYKSVDQNYRLVADLNKQSTGEHSVSVNYKNFYSLVNKVQDHLNQSDTSAVGRNSSRKRALFLQVLFECQVAVNKLYGSNIKEDIDLIDRYNKYIKDINDYNNEQFEEKLPNIPDDLRIMRNQLNARKNTTPIAAQTATQTNYQRDAEILLNRINFTNDLKKVEAQIDQMYNNAIQNQKQSGGGKLLSSSTSLFGWNVFASSERRDQKKELAVHLQAHYQNPNDQNALLKLRDFLIRTSDHIGKNEGKKISVMKNLCDALIVQLVKTNPKLSVATEKEVVRPENPNKPSN